MTGTETPPTTHTSPQGEVGHDCDGAERGCATAVQTCDGRIRDVSAVRCITSTLRQKKEQKAVQSTAETARSSQMQRGQLRAWIRHIDAWKQTSLSAQRTLNAVTERLRRNSQHSVRSLKIGTNGHREQPPEEENRRIWGEGVRG